MTNFEKAYKKLVRFEGGYVFDKDDKGGETYKGIARNYHSTWTGWQLIDTAKEHYGKDFQNYLDENEILQNEVKQFYKEKFWDVFLCDSLPYQIAEEIFEVSVNTGIMRATIILQTALNLLNRNEKFYPDIKIDGKVGPQTLSTLRLCLQKNSEKLLFNVLNILQGAFYAELMLDNPVYEKYIGWFSRIEILK
jgi:lysozyme family protein